MFVPYGEAKLSFTAGGGFNAQNPFGQRSRCCHDICDNAVPCWTCMQSRASSGRVAAELTERLARISVRISWHSRSPTIMGCMIQLNRLGKTYTVTIVHATPLLTAVMDSHSSRNGIQRRSPGTEDLLTLTPSRAVREP